MRLPQAFIGLLLLCTLTAFASPMPSNTLYLGDDGRSASAQALLHAHRMHLCENMAAISRLRDELIRHHAISPRTALPHFDTFIVAGAATRAVAVPRPTRDGTPLITFAYQNWSQSEQTALSSILTTAYSELVSIYGPPITSGTLTIVKGGDQDVLQGGELDVTNPASMTLTLGPWVGDITTSDNDQYVFDLLHLVLHTFHVPALIGFDAWEDGMTRAAAAVAIMQLRPSYSLMYNFTYLLPLYDCMNQPGLATSSFFPAQDISYMSVWRVGMAMSAWLKMYAENPSVFLHFNAAYAAQVAGGNTAIAGDLGSLKGILVGVLPTIEGLPLYQWYDRQFVLQTIPLVGRRMYVYPVPLNESIALQIYYFYTNADGSETPLSGQANLEYLTYDQVPIYPEEGSQVTISATGNTPGFGSINPSFYNIGEVAAQRITINVTLVDQRSTVYFPYMVRGADNSENTFFGALVGADTGTLNTSVPGIQLTPATVVQGSFMQSIPGGGTNNDLSFFAPVQFNYTSADGTTTASLRRNVGPGFYVPILSVADQAAVTLTHTFLTGSRLVTFPLTPNATSPGIIDPAKVLGLAAGSTLQFAWWDPSQQKYLLYPNANLPSITPTRAYWLKLPSSQTATISGTQLGIDDPRSIILQPGWNMIGNTYSTSLYPWEMTVNTGTAAYTLMQAMTQGIVGPMWTYNQDGSFEAKNSVDAWEGGWMVNTTKQPITLQQNSASRLQRSNISAPALSLLAGSGWAMALRAATSTAQDNTAFLGMNAGVKSGVNGLDWLKPPVMGDGVRLAFISPANSNAGAAYASDIRSSIGVNGEVWEFQVSCTQNDQVSLSWPNLRSVPSQYQLVLEDEASNARQYLRTSAVYQYQAKGTTATPDTRRFRLTIEPKTNTPLLSINMQVMPTRNGGGICVLVTPSIPANLQLEVRSTTGRLMQTINMPATRANQPVTITWNGRALGNKLLPSGAYLLNLTAQTADGYVIRQSQPAVLRR